MGVTPRVGVAPGAPPDASIIMPPGPTITSELLRPPSAARVGVWNPTPAPVERRGPYPRPGPGPGPSPGELGGVVSGVFDTDVAQPGGRMPSACTEDPNGAPGEEAAAADDAGARADGCVTASEGRWCGGRTGGRVGGPDRPPADPGPPVEVGWPSPVPPVRVTPEPVSKGAGRCAASRDPIATPPPREVGSARDVRSRPYEAPAACSRPSYLPSSSSSPSSPSFSSSSTSPCSLSPSPS